MGRPNTSATTVVALGLGATVLGVAAYLMGVVRPYPGRAFTVTAVVVGVTVLAVGNAMRGEGWGVTIETLVSTADGVQRRAADTTDRLPGAREASRTTWIHASGPTGPDHEDWL